MPPFDLPNPYCSPGSLDTQSLQVTSYFEQTPWSRTAQTKLKELAALPKNWNSYGSPPIAAEIIGESLKLIIELGKLKMPEPQIFPVSGGGVQFEWKNSVSELEIEMMPNRKIGYLVVDSEGKMYEAEISRNDNFAEFAQLTSWYLNEKTSINDL